MKSSELVASQMTRGGGPFGSLSRGFSYRVFLGFVQGAMATFTGAEGVTTNQKEQKMSTIQIRKHDVEPARQCLSFLRRQNEGFWLGRGEFTRTSTKLGIWLIGGAAGLRFTSRGAARVEFRLGGAFLLRGLVVQPGAPISVRGEGAWFLLELPAHMARDMEHLRAL